MNDELILRVLGFTVVGSPTILLAVLGGASLVGIPLSERAMSRWIQASVITGLIAAIGIVIWMLTLGTWQASLELGDWVAIPEGHFHFTFKLVFDRLSMPFAILSFLLVGTIGLFANVYLHRDSGYRRFFVLYAMFLLGMILTSLAGTIETLFAGWELVGLSSALLVAYFHDRPGPVRNGLRVWMVYRVADAAFMIAAVALHHLTGAGDLVELMGAGPWPAGQASLTSGQALFVGSLLLVAAAGKSALVPFSGWLPRAMEGPTPSSAVFYGSLSVHLGAYLLLRVSPILELSVWLSAAVVALGLITAVYAAMAARVQTDVKSALAFASLTQVGIIVAEIGLGLRYLALIHIIGHACLRTLQLLRAPTLLRDYHRLENAIGSRLPHEPGLLERIVPERLRDWSYRFALERGHLDTLLSDYIVHPFVQVCTWCDGLERRWTRFLSGGQVHESQRIQSPSEVLEELH